ncbi:MAG: S9 family peptidase [Candidatus Eisenbacteria bacterium]|uniref:S9 family peptidase n=1 Tax=Eiseniibacteriota bacterium TaxID=2212470 RepID=A0A7Y2EA57_UNCEI|nr:S9 family peptidase [Candidatus Eisenbacteria bacterium]
MSHFKAPSGETPPLAEKRPHQKTVHGVILSDDYHWLRADNWQEAMREPEKLPEDIKSYLKSENAYYEKAMADTVELQKQLVAEMRGRIKEDDSSVPTKHGDYAYNVRYEEGNEHPFYVRTPRDGGPETMLLDANKEAEGHEYFELGDSSVSPNHRFLAWSRDTRGSEYFAMTIRDLETGKDVDYVIPDVGSVTWGDNETLFYTRVDEHHRPSSVYRHKMGSDPKNDVLVLKETDPRFYMGTGRLRSGKFVVIAISMNDQTEMRVIPTDNLEAEPIMIEPRAEGLEYNLDHQGDFFYINTNADGAADFKIVRAPVSSPGQENWEDVIPAKEGRMVLGVETFEDWLIWMERENALPSIKIRSTKTGETRAIDFEEEAYSLGMAASPEFDSNSLRFTYSSPTTPSQTFDYDLISEKRELRKETEIPSGHDPADYVVRRLMAPSHDGEEVPLTILHHKNTTIDGSAPCLLYGYGSYGMSMPASFSSNRLSLVDRGFVYAIAHIRGGEEKGRAWYEAAKLGGKPNSFKDFLAAGEFLAETKYTSRGQIVCQGGSAGGLLVGAVLNMAPDLFAGCIADVPFVDVLNTILDDTLPLTPGEWSQWGNPIESKEAFDWIAGYSPYDKVEAKAYPPMLVTAGVSDPRVTYWEPAKWVAKLRVTKTDDNALLLRTNMASGHFGKSGRFAALEDAGRSYAFALKVVGKLS